MFLMVPAHLGSPKQCAVKRLLLSVALVQKKNYDDESDKNLLVTD